nr:hypothetical protein [Tanacetum cinerariifolium]GEZ11038.1 hypothetical protein [Tanacetum cinerariifolium]
MDAINVDGFDCDLGKDDEIMNYKKRRLVEVSREMEGVINVSGQWKRNLKLYKNNNVRIRARCDGNLPVFTMSQGTGPTSLNCRMEAGPSGSSDPSTKSKKGRIHVEVNKLRVERLARTHDPLALMANSKNPYNYPVFHQDRPSQITYMQQPLPNNNYIPQPSINQNYMQQPMLNPEDISDPTTAIDMALVLMAKAFRINYSTPTNNNQRISSNPHNRQIAQSGMNMGQDMQIQMVRGNDGNQFRQYNGQNVRNQNRVMGHLAMNYTVKPMRRDVAYLYTKLLIAQKEEARIQLQAKEFDLMAVVGDLNKIKEVNANCILMANLQQASTLGTQIDKAFVYDSDGSAEVLHYDNCYNNDIFNIFTKKEQYTEILDPITEPYMIQQNNNNVIFMEYNVEHNRGTVEQHHATIKETHAYFESLENNLAIEVEKVNLVNNKMQETNAELTTELAR